VTRRRAIAAIVTCAALGCGHAAPTTQTLSGGNVARVGSILIQAPLVAEVARTSRVTARTAVERVVSDALAAEGARAQGIDGTGPIVWSVTTTLARDLQARLLDEARSAGPPTDAELSTLTVAHAVVMRTPGVPRERALAAASAIHQAVTGARSADQFEALANAVPHPGTQAVVERLSAFGADGRGSNGAEYEPSFVAAAFALRSVGDMTWVVETPFGWHTIYLAERTPPAPASVEQLRADLQAAVVEMRVRMRTDAILHVRKEQSAIRLSEAAEALMAEATNAQ